MLAELHVGRGQPAKALPYYLRLRKPHVFDLIREYNLFDAVQEQALLLVEFDQERIKEDPSVAVGKHGAAIELLVDHTLAIPVDRVVQQLEAKPKYLYMYLDSLFEKDPQSCQQYSDRMVRTSAEQNVDTRSTYTPRTTTPDLCPSSVPATFTIWNELCASANSMTTCMKQSSFWVAWATISRH